MQNDVKWVNSNLIKSALSLVESSGWEEVSTEDGIKIWRKYLSPDTMIAGKRLDSAAKFACVKAHTIIDAPIDEVWIFVNVLLCLCSYFSRCLQNLGLLPVRG
jgi:hypothetical protein